MHKFGILNIFLVIIFSLTLTSVSFFCVINKNFKDVPSVINFFNNASVYSNLTEITKITLRNYYAPILQGNVLQLALADKLNETLITPTVVKPIVDGGLKASIAFAKQPTSIIDSKVVVDTTQYKQQVMQDITSWELPNFVNSGINYFVNQVPQYLTLIDNQKHPNNLLTLIIKARALIQYNQFALNIAWVILGITILIILINNILNLKKLMLTLWIGFLISGILTLFVFVFIPWMINNSTPAITDPYKSAQNKLIVDAVGYLIGQIQKTALWYFGFAFIFGLVWKFIKLEKLQTKINKILHKLKIPILSVKVEHL